MARHNICIAVKEKLVKDSGVADDTAYNNIVLKLLTKPRARGKYLQRTNISNTKRIKKTFPIKPSVKRNTYVVKTICNRVGRKI